MHISILFGFLARPVCIVEKGEYTELGLPGANLVSLCGIVGVDHVMTGYLRPKRKHMRSKPPR